MLNIVFTVWESKISLEESINKAYNTVEKVLIATNFISAAIILAFVIFSFAFLHGDEKNSIVRFAGVFFAIIVIALGCIAFLLLYDVIRGMKNNLNQTSEVNEAGGRITTSDNIDISNVANTDEFQHENEKDFSKERKDGKYNINVAFYSSIVCAISLCAILPTLIFSSSKRKEFNEYAMMLDIFIRVFDLILLSLFLCPISI